MGRESMKYDVLVVGAGPAGLAAAIRIKQLAVLAQRSLSVCVLEKGAQVGSHILSGAVLETTALAELLPDWQELGAPLNCPVTEDLFFFLKEGEAYRLPLPPQMRNEGHYVVSLGQFCRWLAQQAESLGVEIYAGFAGAELLLDEHGVVTGVVTGDQGVGRDGLPSTRYQPGMALRAKQTIIAEGCRGSLAQSLIARFGLAQGVASPCYALGIKELWQVGAGQHHEGRVLHTVGWPLGASAYGGGFLYHLDENRVAVGLVTALDYVNPWLSPFEEFQRFKQHPEIKKVLLGGRRLAYGAKALSEGGYQALPKLSFPGGVLVGDSAGLVNVPKIKGSHTAMKSGMLAAEAVFTLLSRTDGGNEATDYSQQLKASWVGKELYLARNIRPAFRWGFWAGMAYAALDTYILRGRAPWTLPHRQDHLQLRPAAQCAPICYPKPDGIVSFDRASSVFLANVHHEDGQPCHLKLLDAGAVISLNLAQYQAPEQRYCPAGVYEIVHDHDGVGSRLQINAQNCLHCKTCDIKDPSQNIRWTVPEGGGGPNYPDM